MFALIGKVWCDKVTERKCGMKDAGMWLMRMGNSVGNVEWRVDVFGVGVGTGLHALLRLGSLSQFAVGAVGASSVFPGSGMR